MGIHQQRTHPEFVPGCAPCRWATVTLFQVGVPQAAADRILAAKRDELEVETYRKLRRQGVQPETTLYPDLLEARNKTRLRDEPYDAATDDGTLDWGSRESLWTRPDGLGDYEPGEPLQVPV